MTNPSKITELERRLDNLADDVDKRCGKLEADVENLKASACLQNNLFHNLLNKTLISVKGLDAKLDTVNESVTFIADNMEKK